MVHSCCVGVVGLEGGSWTVGGWAEEEGMEHWTPSAVGANCEGKEHHVLVKELAHDFATLKIIVSCQFRQWHLRVKVSSSPCQLDASERQVPVEWKKQLVERESNGL